MPERRNNFFNDVLNAVQQNAIAVAVVITVLMMFIPIPKGLIDVSMVLNLAISLTVLLTVIYTKRAAEFTSFPRLILLVTLFGLAINITSTRLILTHPVTGSGARVNMSSQSEMVQAFANIATGNSVVVGFIIFIILIVVQVVVVTKGATRVSEVTARFTLDSMNNKMFDVQNELNSGAITEEQAAQKKARIRQEVDFYSAMDGASKFVSGNVKAGIFITALNLIAGMITGMMMGGMDFASALNSYAKLTIGDGLMSQLPSLMLSFATGILVTGGSTDEVIGEQLKHNFSVSGTIYVIVGVALVAMGLAFHNGSAVVLLPVGALFIYVGIRMSGMEKKQELKKQAEAAAAPAKTRQPGAGPDEVAAAVATLPPLSLDLGYTLVPLVDREKGAELLERVTRIRREEALDLGLVVPPIRIRDSMSVDPDEYVFKIRGIEVGRAKLKLGYYMCLNTGNVPKGRELAGERTRDPAFGMEAIWIPEEKRVEAEKAGYAVIDPPTIIATHLTEIIKRHAAEILTRQEVSSLVNKIKETNPVVVDEVLSGEHKFSYGEIEAVLKNLLAEQVSIRNMVSILETLANFAPLTKDPYLLTEKVRQALGAQICLQYADDDKILHVLRLSQSLSEKMLEHKAEQPGQKPFVAFDPVDGRKYIEQMSAAIAAVRDRNYLPIVLCADEVRQLVKSSTERELPGLVVISIGEVMAAGPEIKIETLGDIDVQ
ncbi:MAG TPA: EscV/YscV/HrcV family type III secretion system export apparatus protein [Treponema sp.]|nr:EscV/YscV/HrcV family type III secretion system export apparatus protein [Treponema sp.]